MCVWGGGRRGYFSVISVDTVLSSLSVCVCVWGGGYFRAISVDTVLLKPLCVCVGGGGGGGISEQYLSTLFCRASVCVCGWGGISVQYLSTVLSSLCVCVCVRVHDHVPGP